MAISFLVKLACFLGCQVGLGDIACPTDSTICEPKNIILPIRHTNYHLPQFFGEPCLSLGYCILDPVFGPPFAEPLSGQKAHFDSLNQTNSSADFGDKSETWKPVVTKPPVLSTPTRTSSPPCASLSLSLSAPAPSASSASHYYEIHYIEISRPKAPPPSLSPGFRFSPVPKETSPSLDLDIFASPSVLPISADPFVSDGPAASRKSGPLDLLNGAYVLDEYTKLLVFLRHEASKHPGVTIAFFGWIVYLIYLMTPFRVGYLYKLLSEIFQARRRAATAESELEHEKQRRMDYDALKEELEKAKSATDQLTFELSILRSETTDLKSRNDQLIQEKTDIKKEVNQEMVEIQTKLNQEKAEIQRKLSHEKAEVEKSLESLKAAQIVQAKEKAEKTSLKRQLATVESASNQKSHQVSQLQSENTEVKLRNQELAKENTEIKKKLNHEKLEIKSKFKQEKAEVDEELAALKAAQIAQAKEQAEETSQKKTEHAKALAALNSRIAELEKTNLGSEDIIDALRADNSALRATIDESKPLSPFEEAIAKGAHAHLKRQIEGLEEKNATMKQELNDAFGEELSLIFLRDELEGALEAERQKVDELKGDNDLLQSELGHTKHALAESQEAEEDLKLELVAQANMDNRAGPVAEVGDDSKHALTETQRALAETQDALAETQHALAETLHALEESQQAEEDLKLELAAYTTPDDNAGLDADVGEEENDAPSDASETATTSQVAPMDNDLIVSQVTVPPTYDDLRIHPLSPSFEHFIPPSPALSAQKPHPTPPLPDATAVKAFLALAATDEVPEAKGWFLSSLKISEDPSRTYEKYIRGSFSAKECRERVRKINDFMKKVADLRLREPCDVGEEVALRVSWLKDMRDLPPVMKTGLRRPRRHSLTFGDRNAAIEQVDAEILRAHSVQEFRRDPAHQCRSSARNVLLTIDNRSYTGSGVSHEEFQSLSRNDRRIFFDDFFQVRQETSSSDTIPSLRITDIYNIDNPTTKLRLDTEPRLNTPLAGFYPYDSDRSLWTKPECLIPDWQARLPQYMSSVAPFELEMPEDRADILDSAAQQKITTKVVSGTSLISSVGFTRDPFIYHECPAIASMQGLDAAHGPKWTIGSTRAVPGYVDDQLLPETAKARKMRLAWEKEKKTSHTQSIHDGDPVVPLPFRDQKSWARGLTPNISFPLVAQPDRGPFVNEYAGWVAYWEDPQETQTRDEDGLVVGMEREIFENENAGDVPVWESMEETRSRDEDGVVDAPVDPKTVKPRVHMKIV